MADKDKLPDSRLNNPIGTVLVDWEFEEYRFQGQILQKRKVRYRLELEPIFCFNCGVRKGYVPRGLFSWIAFLCDPCSESVGEAALALDRPDMEFWYKVEEEMMKTYGKALSQAELEVLAARCELSHGLQLLERECPLPRMNP